MELLGQRLKTAALIGLALSFVAALALQRLAPDHVSLVVRAAGAMGAMAGVGAILSREVVLSGRYGGEMRIVGAHAIAFGVAGVLFGGAVFLGPSALAGMRASGSGAPAGVTPAIAGVAFGLAVTIGASAMFFMYVGVLAKTPSLLMRAWGYVTLALGLGTMALGGLLIAGVAVMTLFR